MTTHRRAGRKASGSNPDEDDGPKWGSCGADCKGGMVRGQPMPSHLSLSFLRGFVEHFGDVPSGR